MGKKLIIKQVRSSISTKPSQRATLIGLGLRGMNQSREHDDNRVIRGMIDKVRHLIQITEK